MDSTPKSAWTPDLKMQALKEGITGVLGMAVVGYTLYVTGLTFVLAGDKAKMADAKDILTLLLGLSGVVVGYYFGRVPADARAAQSDQRAGAATAHMERVRAKGEQVADHLEAMLSSPATRAGLDLNDPAVQDLQRLRDELREMTNLAGGR